MEDSEDKCLTVKEKVKLKEKLALLKKEYKKTFNRLQRSQRAERVKAHVKKTIEEQNRSRRQDRKETLTSEPPCFSASTLGDVIEPQRSYQADKARESYVTFNADPEIHCAGASSPQDFKRALVGQGNPFTPKNQGNRDQIPRSRLKLNRSKNRDYFVESSQTSICLRSSSLSESGRLRHEVPSLYNPASPVCIKQTDSHNISLKVDGAGAAASHPLPSDCAENRKPAGTTNVNKTDPVPNTLIARGNSIGECHHPGDHTKRTFLLSTDVEGISTIDTAEKPRGSKQNTKEGQKRQSGSIMKCPMEEAASRAFNNAGERNTTHNALQDSVEQKPLQVDNVAQKESSLTGEQSSPLSSCTLVEGLLFPVEYYVRTTRRMSSCQRKVDLDAVIHSQLGTGRRASRGRAKQEKGNMAQDCSLMSPSPQGLIEHGSVASRTSRTPLSHPSTGRSRGRRRKCKGSSSPIKMQPLAASPDLKDLSVQLEFAGITSGSQSEKENCEGRALTGTDPQVNPVCSTTEAGNLRVTEGSNPDEDQTLPAGQSMYTLRPRNSASFHGEPMQNDLESFESNLSIHKALKQDPKCAGSTFYSLSTWISIKDLPICLDIRDFHLPDEEFGDLKLKKLNTVSHWELCVPKLNKEAKRTGLGLNGKKSTLAPPSECSPVELETMKLYSDDPEDDFKLLSEDQLRGLECSARLGQVSTESLRNNTMPSELSLTPDLSNLLNSNMRTSRNELASSESSKGDPLSSQQSLTPDLLNLFDLSITLPDQKPKEKKDTKFKNDPFPLTQSLSKTNLDAASHGETCKEQDVNLLEQTIVGRISDAQYTSETLCSSDTPSFAAEDLEMHEQTQTKVASSLILESLPLDPSLDLESDGVSSLNSELRLAKVKETARSALFSSSVCSMPQENFDGIEVVASVPGFPVLGSTPAITPPHQSRDSPLVSCSSKPVVESVVSTETLPARVASDECLSAGGEGNFFPEIDVKQCNTTVSLTGSECERCAHTELEETCQQSELCGKQSLGYPVGTTDGNSSQQLAKAAQLKNTADVEEGMRERDHLRLVSQIQDGCGGACAVDLSSCWWEFPNRTDCCIVAASESCVILWRPRSEDSWETAHTWNFMEMPVIQILPLPGEKNIVCVALGNPEIREIWLLFSCPGSLNWEQQIVKRGHTKIAMGLSQRRIAICSSLGSNQVVEILQLSTNGSSVRSQSLMPPKESILAFCELDGQKDALIGSTANNNMVIWNSITGQLLSNINVGELCSDCTCLSASSESGLVFLVLVSPYSSECIFRLIAANPKGAKCVNVMQYTLPEDHASRYLEGNVKNQKAVAVLTCGSIALWELSIRQCSALLPPAPGTRWCLVRWAHSSSSVLTAQNNGTICVYSLTESSQTRMSEELAIWDIVSPSVLFS
ncbi:partner and localizer of BRCA2 isoform X1 [Pelobates fuscus]|uniref:partner and localizer of BRCA2 isoform X1 n=1 Tax=Pelobates fuscus TaxID=191477 RepID=UPI002FE47C5D